MEPLFAGMTIENVVNKYSDSLIRIAYSNTKSRVEAEDIVQEVYIKLLKHQGSFDTPAQLKSWLIKVTCNRCKDLFRSFWVRNAISMDEGMDILAPEEQQVMEEIFKLKRDDRNIIYLHYYEGYSLREIASMLGKNENTISTRMQRARKKLRRIIEEGGRGYECKLQGCNE